MLISIQVILVIHEVARLYIYIIIIVLAKIINRLFHEKSTKQPCRSQGNTNL